MSEVREYCGWGGKVNIIHSHVVLSSELPSFISRMGEQIGLPALIAVVPHVITHETSSRANVTEYLVIWNGAEIRGPNGQWCGSSY